MSFEIYFVNKTKKEIVSSKSITDGFEDGLQLLAYLRTCNRGNEIIIEDECSEFIENFLYNGKHNEYKQIKIN